MTYNEFLNRKNADNYYYKIEWAHTGKTIWRGCNYSRVIEICKGIENQVLIWID